MNLKELVNFMIDEKTNSTVMSFFDKLKEEINKNKHPFFYMWMGFMFMMAIL